MTAVTQALEQSLQEYAETVRALRGDKLKNRPYACIEEYVLKHGRAFTSFPLTAAEQAIVFAAVDNSHRRYPRNQCFSNAQWLVLYGQDQLTYVEGYVVKLSLSLPLLHGWVELNGKVVDLTLRRSKPKPKRPGRFQDRVLGEFDDRAYFGVRFSETKEILHLMLSRSSFGSLLDDYQSGYHLLKGGTLAELSRKKVPI